LEPDNDDIFAFEPSKSTQKGEKERDVLLRVASKLEKSRNSLHTWYSLTPDDIAKAGGSKLLDMYQEDIFALTLAAFPALPLEPWRFSGGALRCVSDPKYRRQFLLWLKEELKIDDASHWRAQIRKGRLQKIGSAKFSIFHVSKSFQSDLTMFFQFIYHQY
jgi:hypothetical protein